MHTPTNLRHALIPLLQGLHYLHADHKLWSEHLWRCAGEGTE